MHRLHAALLRIVHRSSSDNHQQDIYKLFKRFIEIYPAASGANIDLKFAVCASIPLTSIGQKSKEIAEKIVSEMSKNEQLIVEFSCGLAVTPCLMHLKDKDIVDFRTKMLSFPSEPKNVEISLECDPTTCTNGAAQRPKRLNIEFDFDDDEPMMASVKTTEELLRRASVDADAIVAAHRRGELDMNDVARVKRICELLKTIC